MINVLLVGNPNTGKTTLFNSLTSSSEHVGNWHGVTVEEKRKKYNFKGEEINVVDLPGIYSMTPMSYEESVATDYILSHPTSIIINTCDSGNLERNLYLTVGLMELGMPIILAVNQIDKKPVSKINFALLEKNLGIKVVAINAREREGVEKLSEEIIKFDLKIEKKSYKLPYINELDLTKTRKYTLDTFFQVKLLEDDEKVKAKFGVLDSFKQCEKVAQKRYEFIEKTIQKSGYTRVKTYGDSKLDKIFLNKFLAFPIFLLFLGLAFYLTFFSVGSTISTLLERSFTNLLGDPLISFVIGFFGENSWIVHFIKVAVVGGVGSILTFLPQVALLFFFLSLLEDSGYLSRVAFVFDDILGKVGLSGKSVYTILMGFGCSTTAALTARTMDDKNSKIKASLLSPYMSCSAKFPLYAVLGGAFFGAKNIFIIFGLYLLGIIVAIVVSFIFEKTILKSKEQSFILEFPPYRQMGLKRIGETLWKNVKEFILRVGSLILAMNVIVWILSNFTFSLHYVQNGRGSILEVLGRIIAPIFVPLGFNNWALASALIAGLVAKEVILSSMAMFNGVTASQVELQKSFTLSSSLIFFPNPIVALSYLVFALLYSPCLATISVLHSEIGAKWTALGIVFQFVFAYLTTLIIFTYAQAISAYGLFKSIVFALCALIILIALIVIIKKFTSKGKMGGCAYCDRHCKK